MSHRSRVPTPLKKPVLSMAHQNMGAEKGSERPSGRDDNGKDMPGVMGGAALIGAGVGAIVAGPLGAIALGAGAAGLCLRDDKAGQVARTTGQAGIAIMDKGKEVNQRYHVTETVRDAAQGTYQKARELDQNHGITDKTKAGAMRAWETVRKADKEHNVSSRAMDGWSSAMKGVTKALAGNDASKGGGRTSSDTKK